jgi:hypothetical protein
VVIAVVCRQAAYAIPTAGIIAAALKPFRRGRGHFATCNRLFQITGRLMIETDGSQLYVGKCPISKGIGRIIRRFVVSAFHVSARGGTPAPSCNFGLGTASIAPLRLQSNW